LVKNHETGLTFESGSVESLVVACEGWPICLIREFLEMGISGAQDGANFSQSLSGTDNEFV